MCLILIALNAHPAYKLIIASNRDEFFDRPATGIHFWENTPDLLAGKDLRDGGTWLGITKQGRIATITNYRDPALLKTDAPSRGRFVLEFLLSHETPEEFIKKNIEFAHKCNGFNLILGERNRLYWYSNVVGKCRRLAPAIYGLSNHLLDTPWPKVTRAKTALQELISEKSQPLPEDLFTILSDRSMADDRELPDTGISTEWEKRLSSIFIPGPVYGTRSSTLLFLGHDDRVTVMERVFGPDSTPVTDTRFEFRITS